MGRSGPPFLLNKTFLILEVLARLTVLIATVIFSATYAPFVRRVRGTDWSKYAYPYEERQMFSEMTAAILIVIMAVVILLLGLAVLRWLGHWSWKIIIEETILHLLGITLSAGVAYLTSELLKRMYGRPRPDYLSRCLGSSNYHEWMDTMGWSSWEDIPEIPTCQGHTNLSEHALHDGRMSFPSAHALLSFAILGFSALWVYSKMCLFRNLGSWRLVIPFGILVVPLAVAISRTSDYRHHPSDVVAGIFLGSLAAYVSFIFYFPLKLRPMTQAIYDRRGAVKAEKPERFSYCEAVRLPPAKDDEVELTSHIVDIHAEQTRD